MNRGIATLFAILSSNYPKLTNNANLNVSTRIPVLCPLKFRAAST